MGTADVIPGVSGGTMAFILGIYMELIAAIKSFDWVWLQGVFCIDIKKVLSRPHFEFLIPLFVGIVTALLFFTRIIELPRLIQIYPEQVYGLFFGLICGSIIVLFQDMAYFNLKAILPISTGMLLGLIVVNLVPVQTPEASWFVFITGCLSICAMILPGISGSFILLILNKYTYIFNAIGYLKFNILIPFAFGAITGLIVFSRILYYLLNNFYRNTILVIIGVLIASLWVIWPFQERSYEIIRGKLRLIDSVPLFPAEFSLTVIFSISLIITGFIVVLVINKFAVVKSESAD